MGHEGIGAGPVLNPRNGLVFVPASTDVLVAVPSKIPRPSTIRPCGQFKRHSNAYGPAQDSQKPNRRFFGFDSDSMDSCKPGNRRADYDTEHTGRRPARPRLEYGLPPSASEAGDPVFK